jgi:hypothetical protein
MATTAKTRRKRPYKKRPQNAALARHAAASQVPMPEFVARPRPRGDKLINKEAVLERVGLSYAQVWKLMHERRFPSSVGLGGKVGCYGGDEGIGVAIA